MKRISFLLFALVCLNLSAWADSIFVVSGISYRKVDEKSVAACANADHNDVAFIDSILSIPASVTHDGREYRVRSIGVRAFAKCCGIKSVNISNGIEEIEDAAFEACANLKEVTIPASVKTMGRNPFSFCLNLSSVKVDSGNSVFDSRDGCNAIIRKQDNALVIGCSNTSIPSSVETICEEAFHGCTIETLVLPEGVTGIMRYAFCECPFLKSISVPSTVERIDSHAFVGCGNISSITVDKDNAIYDSRDNCNAIIDKDAEMLVLGCSSTTIPSSVSVIGERAFSESVNLRSVNIPEGVTAIMDCAFYRCYALKRVSLPSTLARFEGHTHFGHCVSLDSIFIPKSVKELPNDLFMGCSSLEKLIVDEKNATYDSRNDCNAIVETSNDELVSGCKGSVIPDGVMCIGENSFLKSGITSIHIPASVADIHPAAFRSCELCKSITVDGGNKHYKSDGTNTIVDKRNGRLVLACSSSAIPQEVSVIGSYAFTNTPPVMILPSGIKEIEDCAFVDCTDLYTIFIPATVRKIGKLAFAGCRQLSNVIVMGKDVVVGKDAFKGCYNFNGGL